ncbi:hypothetical protein GY45DRAFT_1037118 [Cubamyces sp. BRFM 1775]|nr:hypothetical protein GY45DRAFT_1037118 [Cubamyces sp. BRFM 1775]
MAGRGHTPALSGEHRRPGGAVAIDAHCILNATISPGHATPNAPGPLRAATNWENSLHPTVSSDRTPPLLCPSLSSQAFFPLPPLPLPDSAAAVDGRTTHILPLDDEAHSAK